MRSTRFSYKELVEETYEDAEMMGYLTRFVLKHNGPSPKVQDLHRYTWSTSNFLDEPWEHQRVTWVKARRPQLQAEIRRCAGEANN